MKILIYKIYNLIYLFFEKFFGIQIIRANYSSPLPLTKELTNKIYKKEYSSNGIDFNIKKQFDLINNFCNNFSNEFLPKANSGLSLVDTFILHSFIRTEKPIKIVEVGYGDTTKIILNASKYNKNKSKFYSIDPFLKKKARIKSQELVLIEKKVQDIPISFFEDVDFLFIDSSHIFKIGSDVNFLMFDVIPILKKNTIIHWHDIYIPFNYPKCLIEYIRRDSMYNESYIVQSFISYNKNFEILYAGQYLKRKHPNYLKGKFSYYLPKHNLTSFYIRKI